MSHLVVCISFCSSSDCDILSCIYHSLSQHLGSKNSLIQWILAAMSVLNLREGTLYLLMKIICGVSFMMYGVSTTPNQFERGPISKPQCHTTMPVCSAISFSTSPSSTPSETPKAATSSPLSSPATILPPV